MKRIWITAITMGMFLSLSPFLSAASVAAPTRFTLTKATVRCTQSEPSIMLTWRSSKNATGYQIQRKQVGTMTWVTLKPARSTTTSFVDDSLMNGRRYIYRVVARRGAIRVHSNSKRVAASCATSMPQSSQSAKPWWGASVGWRPEDGEAFERMVDASTPARAVFVHWGNEREFPSDLAPALKGKTLVIFWEAMNYDVDGVDQPDFSYAAILRGDWDAYIESFARQAKAYSEPVILIPFEEMNGDWYPWSGTQNGNTPAEHIAAYRYLRAFFRSAPNVQFGWAVNAESVPNTTANRIDAYYPGDDVVDYVGVDGFNTGDPWASFDAIFGKALATLKTKKKPIILFSMASAEGPRKAVWIRDALTTQLPRHPQIKGWIWFHENKEHDWRVNSDPASLEAFKNAIR